MRCVFSSTPLATVERLLVRGAACPDGERIAACEIDLSRPVFEMGGTLVRGLARAALAVWPDWYGDPDQFRPCDEPSLQSTLDRLATGRAARRQQSVLRPWVSRAVSLCRTGTPPVVPAFSPTVQARQLALAVADTLTLVVRAEPADGPEPAGLLGLARNLEWLARHTDARVVAVLPVAWSARTELDAISWEGRTVDEVEPASSGSGPALDEPLASVRPICGRPHPDSPGEQLMASHLRRDPILGPLFEYNVPVATVRGSRYLVDLVWFDGKVAVEIDSYRWHSSPTNFASDRHRDYELQLSGFLVLRLTHAGVMGDVELAVDKVRDLVKLRAGPPLPPPEAGRMSHQPTTAEHRLLWMLVAKPDGEFESVLKPTKAKQTREALVRAKLIEVEKRVRPSRSKRKVKAIYLRLTDAGWAWCNQRMAWQKPRGKSEQLLDSLLQRLKVLFSRQGTAVSLADFILNTTPPAPGTAPALPPNGTAAAPPPPVTLAGRIRTACLDLGGGREAVRIRIADLRQRLADVPADQLTEGLRELSRRRELTLYPLDDPRQITPEDEAAAVHSSTGVPQHILYIGGIAS